MKDTIESIASGLIAIGIFGCFAYEFELRPDLPASVSLICFGVLVYLVCVLETMDDRWR